MRKTILTLLALTGMAFAVNAQNNYDMVITKTDGSVISIPTNEIRDVTFEEIAPTDDDPYTIFAGDWTLTFVDFDNIAIRDITISLPDPTSADYGKMLYAHAPAFLQGSNNYDLDFKMRYTYDEATESGTVSIVVDDAAVGKLDDTHNIFLRLDNLPASDDFITGEYVINWSLANVKNGDSNRAADRSQTLYFVSGQGETYTQMTGILNILGDARLKKK